MSPSLANPIIETLMTLNTKQCDEDLDQILANVEEELKSGRYQSGLKIPTTEGAILTLFIEFARHSKQSTPQQLADFCRQEIGLSNEDVVKHICQTFEKVHKRITFYLLQTTSTMLPHIVDASTELKYELVTSGSGRSGKFFYLVTLKVQPGSGLGTEDVQIVCSDQELQDFVSRLKDAKNNLEKIANK